MRAFPADGWRFGLGTGYRFAGVDRPGRSVQTPPALEILVAVAVMAAAFLWIHYASITPLTEFERTRDLVAAQDCNVFGRCSLIGPPSSTANLHQGAVWIEILTAFAFLHGSTIDVFVFVNVLLSLGVATVFLVAWRWFRLAVAVISIVVVLALLDRVCAAGQFVNPSTEFFPAALAGSGLLIFALTGRFSLLVWATVCLSLACGTHTGSLGLVPAWVALAAVAGPVDLGFALGVFLATAWITSPEALLHNLRDSTVNGPLVITGLVGTATAATVLAPRFIRLGVAGRAAVVGALMVGPFALYMTCRQCAGLRYEWLYWPPVIAPVAIGAAGLFVSIVEWLMARVRWFDWLAPMVFLAIGAGAGCFAVQSHLIQTNRWTYDTARLVQSHRLLQGWSYSRLARGLQVENRYYLLLGLMPYALPDRSAEPTYDPHRQVRVWLRDLDGLYGENLPRGAEVVHVADSTRVLVFSAIDSWLDPWREDICVGSLTSTDRICSHPPPSPDLAIQPFSLSNRLLTGQGFGGNPGPAGCRVSHAIPVQPTAGAVHLFAAPSVPWRFTHVTGLDVMDALPAEHIRLRSRDGSPGQITMEAVFGPGSPECSSSAFPELIESLPGDPPWTH